MEYPTILVKYWGRRDRQERHINNRWAVVQKKRSISSWRSLYCGPSHRLALWTFCIFAAASASANDCPPGLWPHTLQGTGEASPLAGEVVSVRGTVTYTDARRTGLRGFFIQGPSDQDIQSSEAVFVYAPNHRPNRLDEVVVKGEVKEFHSLTELTQVHSVTRCGRDVLPHPIWLAEPTEALENMR
ncbi:MAG: hypothetical protein WED11_08935, partial [Natronospirillum sp.]